MGLKLADHFIIRLCVIHRDFRTKEVVGIVNEEPRDKDGLIAGCLIDNGYALGQATVDFKVTDSIPDAAYMTSLVLKYTDTGHTVNDKETKMYNLSGRIVGSLDHIGEGMLVAVYHD